MGKVQIKLLFCLLASTTDKDLVVYDEAALDLLLLSKLCGFTKEYVNLFSAKTITSIWEKEHDVVEDFAKNLLACIHPCPS